MQIILTKNFISEYTFWRDSQKSVQEKIDRLIEAISTNPFEGIGKPEKLKGDMRNLWSRRITKKDRLVYSVDDNTIVLISCWSHYVEL